MGFVSIWDVRLEKLQESRLLALRMHVARYVVRVGARQRTVVAVLEPDDVSRFGETLLELLEAAGARSAEVIASGDAVPEADIVLVARHRSAGQGDAALPLDPPTDSSKASLAALARPPSLGDTQLWEIDVERIAGGRDARIVESVEALIRIVMPEALGANGTPPDEAVAVRVA